MHPLVPRLATLAAVAAAASSLVNTFVPEPYLDEVFHVPQAQSYCLKRFAHWDPKLTTPPGLYLLSYPLSWLLPCTPALLRAINAVGVALVLPAIVYNILLLLHPGDRQAPAARSAAAHTAVNVSLFPLMFFFAGLYYTDVYSTVFVLASYMLWLQGRTWWSAGATWGGLWFRQTNVLWAVFLLALEGVRALEVAQGPEKVDVKEEVLVEVVKEKEVTPITPTASPGGKRKKKKGRANVTPPTPTPPVLSRVNSRLQEEEVQEEVLDGPWTIDVKSTAQTPSGELAKAWSRVVETARGIRIWNPVFGEEVTAQDFLFSTPISIILAALQYAPALLLSTLPYITVLASFVVFIIWNDFSIVLGDKSAHQPTLHIPQLYYFSLFTLLTSWPLLLSQRFVQRFWDANVAVYVRLPRRRGRKLPRKLPPSFAAAAAAAAANRDPVSVSWTTLLRTTCVLLLILITVYKNTYLHPYLLADNRHFVFYVFRRTILLHPVIRYLLAPVYFAAAWAVFEGLRAAGAVSVVWVWAWSVAVVGTLIGAGLVEGRYFVVGWVMWRLHVERLCTGVGEAGWETWGWRRWVETLGFVGVDAGVLYVFLNWGFEWESEKGRVQRFMW